MKTHFSMEQHLCIVCTAPYDTGVLLLHKHLKPTLDAHTITTVGGMCPEHQRLKDEGYIALVECDPTRTVVIDGGVKPADAYRTGVIVHIRHEVARQLFSKDVTDTPVIFIEPDVTAALQRRMPTD